MATVVEIKYDTAEAVKAIQDLTVALQANKTRQEELKKELKNGQISQADYAIEMSKVTSETARQSQEIKKHTTVLNSEIGSIKRAKAENQVLREERNKLGDATGKNAKLIEAYNRRIDANTEIINGNVDKQSKLYLMMGKLEGAAGGAAGGFVGMGKAAMAFVMNPIGAIIAAIVAVLMLLKKALNSTEDGSNKMDQALAILSGMFNALMDVLRPVAEFLINNILSAFNSVGKAADWAIGIVSKGLKSLGFDKAAKAVDDYNAKIKENIKLSQQLAAEQAKLKESLRWAEKIQLDYQKAAEKLRQIRDDESKTIKERTAANEQLGKVLQDQLGEELAIAKQQLKVAEMKIKAEGASSDNLDARADAMTRISDIEERISGQESEQLQNLNSLRKEASDKLKEQADARIALEQKVLDFQKSIAEDEKKLNQDIINQQIETNNQLEINNATYLAAIEAADAEEMKVRTNAIVELAKLKEDELLKDVETEEERKKLLIEAAESQKIAKIDASKGTNEELELIEYEHTLALEAIADESNARIAEKRQEMLDKSLSDMQTIIDASQGMADTRFTIASEGFAKLATIDFAEIKSATDAFTKIGTAAKGLTGLITAGYDKQLSELEKEKEAELALVGDSAAGQAAVNAEYEKKANKLKKEQAQKEKAKAIVDSIIATAIAVVKAIAASPVTGGLPFSAIVGALGAAQTAVIASQPITYAKGGMIGGNSHSQGGTKFFGEDGSVFEAERGESMFVLKKNATAEIAALSAFNQSFGGRSWTDGGSSGSYADGGEVTTPNMNRAVAEALQNTTIIVRVEDIATGLTNVDNVKKAGVI